MEYILCGFILPRSHSCRMKTVIDSAATKSLTIRVMCVNLRARVFVLARIYIYILLCACCCSHRNSADRVCVSVCVRVPMPDISYFPRAHFHSMCHALAGWQINIYVYFVRALVRDSECVRNGWIVWLAAAGWPPVSMPICSRERRRRRHRDSRRNDARIRVPSDALWIVVMMMTMTFMRSAGAHRCAICANSLGALAQLNAVRAIGKTNLVRINTAAYRLGRRCSPHTFMTLFAIPGRIKKRQNISAANERVYDRTAL